MLRLVMASIALATAGIASYLVWVHYQGGSLVCTTGGCATVQQSDYADIFGIPVALVGLVGALAILLSLLRSDVLGRAVGMALAVSGCLFAMYLVLVQLTVLHAVCEWCVANDVLMTALAAVALLRVQRDLVSRSRLPDGDVRAAPRAAPRRRAFPS
jgi:uncharacterized membrane protein